MSVYVKSFHLQASPEYLSPVFVSDLLRPRPLSTVGGDVPVTDERHRMVVLTNEELLNFLCNRWF